MMEKSTHTICRMGMMMDTGKSRSACRGWGRGWVE